MTEEQKKKYLLLKKNNKELTWKNDTMYMECVNALRECSVLSYEETNNIFVEFQNKYPISVCGSINWKTFDGITKVMNMISLHNLKKQDSKYFILWDKEGLPCIKSELAIILKKIDDVLAVSFDTWLLSENGTEVIEFHHEGRITYGKLL